MNPITRQGFLLISTIVLLVVGGLLAGSIAHVFMIHAKTSVSHVETTNALYIADAGLQRASHELLRFGTLGMTCQQINGNAAFTNMPFGEGAFTVEATSFISQPTAALISGGVSATDTIIRISNAAYNYAPSGRVSINDELVDYHGVSTDSSVCGGPPRCLLNAKRGQGGTVAASHPSGSMVEQNQCYLVSTGGIPDLTAPRARRAVSQSITGNGIGVAVGQVPDHVDQDEAPTYLRWDEEVLTRLCPKPFNCPNGPNTAPETNMYEASMVNQAFGWAVGGSLNTGTAILTWWDGGQWTHDPALIHDNTVADADYFGITCLAENHCWAVGDQSIIFWNGAQWRGDNMTPQSAQDDEIQFRDVVCTSASNCWAVGTQGGNYAPPYWRYFDPLPSPTPPSPTYTNNGDWPIYHYNGTVWQSCSDDPTCSVEPSAPRVHLFGVTCVSDDDCWAVGANETFLHWNGLEWQHDHVLQDGVIPAPDPGVQVPFYRVACLETNDCWAVGSGEDWSNGGKALIAHWDGNSWSRAGNHPLLSYENYVGFYDITCIATNECWAVGEQVGGWATYIKYDGASWSRVGQAVWGPPEVTGESGVPHADLYGIDYVGGFGPAEAINWYEIAN